MGKSEGAGSPLIAAAQAAVRYAKTSRRCWRSVVTVVKMRSTNWLPAPLGVPKLRRRHNTARRDGRSALLFVGSTSASHTNVHRAASSFTRLRHVRWVFASVGYPNAKSVGREPDRRQFYTVKRHPAGSPRQV